ncbi:hypothetical protein [Agrobacterium tumefaciens]|uniref:hypothetical protein n=1 Tax=Agrobacterium tumefaciens TaxID=358 RepID=UPI001572B4E2|nr:hypothetical protein [Agrobacterium tumefaciens]NTD10803.1 hypothetical protein [Agrobacterium tumefaciens]
MIVRPEPRELTQGTIFTCAMAENYNDCDVHGLIITARCDVANGKAAIFSYIPVLPYTSWALKDGAEIVAQRISANCAGELRKIVKAGGLSETILETISVDAIKDNLDKDQTKDGKARSKKFSEFVSKKLIADEFLSSNTHEKAQKLIADNIGVYHGLVKELVGNSVADFHYLDQIEYGKEPTGHVALLREIRFMPSRIATKIVEGIDRNDYSNLESVGAGGMRFRTDDDYAMPVGLLKSPFVEFLMQRLMNLFGRIGVTDVSQQRIDALKNAFSELEIQK